MRNPYNPVQVTRYDLSPDVVDLIGFCTKNPAPMPGRMGAFEPYGQYWFVTIAGCGRESEPGVLCHAAFCLLLACGCPVDRLGACVYQQLIGA